jgi:hypothetical protein
MTAATSQAARHVIRGRVPITLVLDSVSRVHITVANEAGLQSVPRDYVAYYLHTRTHLTLEKDPPIPRSVAPSSTEAWSRPHTSGGLHHRYDRVAA